jgi:F-box/leucine-rich repeat protein 2/20
VEEIKHPNLQVLNLSWCKNLSDEAIMKIVDGCPYLEALHLAWCSNISSNAILALVKKTTKLRILNVRGCNKVPMLMIKFLSASGKMIYR